MAMGVAASTMGTATTGIPIGTSLLALGFAFMNMLDRNPDRALRVLTLCFFPYKNNSKMFAQHGTRFLARFLYRSYYLISSRQARPCLQAAHPERARTASARRNRASASFRLLQGAGARSISARTSSVEIARAWRPRAESRAREQQRRKTVLSYSHIRTCYG